jgi:hypothetical protein
MWVVVQHGGHRQYDGQYHWGTATDKLQMQNIWSNIDQSGTVIRIFQTSTGTNDTLGYAIH